MAVTRFFLERREAAPDLRRLFDWLDGEQVTGGSASECAPPMDVLETAETLEVVVDLPGVSADTLRIIYSSGVLVIAGQKIAKPCEHLQAAFHLAERSFGGFARIIRLTGAFDAGRARATLAGGELHVVLPRIEERRGQRIDIPVEAN